MGESDLFERYADEYDRWFDEHPRIYRAEIRAVGRFLPHPGLGIEVGVGTGRFAAPFGIGIGVDPARQMVRRAQARGLAVCQARGERLPFRAGQFDYALLVTVICFVPDPLALLQDVHRVLRPGGPVIIGWIARDSPLGRLYERRREHSRFYREATFYTVSDVVGYVRRAGFGQMQFSQTLFGIPDDDPATFQVRDGYGEGAFVVLRAVKLAGEGIAA